MARWFVDRSPQRGIPSVRLRKLLPDARFVGCEDLLACGCSSELRRLQPGQVFVAAGEKGRSEVVRALDKGAAAVIVESPFSDAGNPQVIVSDARRALGRVCQALAGDPGERLSLVAVTGASGKTAISHYLRAIEEASGGRCGYLGSDGWSDGSTHYPPGASAPGAEALAEMLCAMLECGCRSGVIAAPSADWDSRRLAGVGFEAAVIADGGTYPPKSAASDSSSLRRGHARAFQAIAPGGVAVVHADDPEAELMGGVNLDASRVTFALGRSEEVDVSARIERLDAGGTLLTLFGFDRAVSVHLQLIGARRALHALAAAAVAKALGFSLDLVVAGLESVTRLPGRLDRVSLGQHFEIRVDRARTPAALREALVALREVSRGKVHCMIGASGDLGRDAALARVAEEHADSIVVTLDQPTIVDHDRAMDNLVAALERPGRARLENVRQRAIEALLAIARPGDGVLLAGDPYSLNLSANRFAPCDDRTIASRWLGQAASRRTRKSA
jgi:UDP-N-acetylmuramoyl-L-alanyl-D-glutamate--2,6-diaminopimelate ligase